MIKSMVLSIKNIAINKKKLKGFRFLIFWESLHFADRNKNLAKSKITNFPSAQFSERIRYHSLGLLK